MAAVTGQVAVHVVVAHADAGSLVALAEHLEPPVAGGIAAEVAHARRPVVAADQVGDAQVHGEQRGHDEQRALVAGVIQVWLLSDIACALRSWPGRARSDKPKARQCAF